MFSFYLLNFSVLCVIIFFDFFTIHRLLTIFSCRLLPQMLRMFEIGLGCWFFILSVN